MDGTPHPVLRPWICSAELWGQGRGGGHHDENGKIGNTTTI